MWGNSEKRRFKNKTVQEIEKIFIAKKWGLNSNPYCAWVYMYNSPNMWWSDHFSLYHYCHNFSIQVILWWVVTIVLQKWLMCWVVLVVKTVLFHPGQLLPPVVLYCPVQSDTHTHTHTLFLMHTHAHTDTCTHTRTHAMHTHIHVHTHTHTNAHTHGRTHTLQLWSWRGVQIDYSYSTVAARYARYTV